METLPMEVLTALPTLLCIIQMEQELGMVTLEILEAD